MEPLTITIYYSEMNGGYMYDVYNAEASEVEESESIDGGLCTGSIEDAIEMAKDCALGVTLKIK